MDLIIYLNIEQNVKLKNKGINKWKRGGKGTFQIVNLFVKRYNNCVNEKLTLKGRIYEEKNKFNSNMVFWAMLQKSNEKEIIE